MKTLYPNLNKRASAYLKHDGVHTVYFEESGNRLGIPVIFLHGGPGSGCHDDHRRYFNPDRYRIILFDQRGCHRSTPNGGVENNTTAHILADIEAIRSQLGIEKWVLFGGSWGATLALLYAEALPNNVLGIILRGTFLARECDFDWFAKNGVNRIFPDHWQAFAAFFSNEERHRMVESLYQRLLDKDTQWAAAKAWSLWSGRIVTYGVVDDYVLEEDNQHKIINQARIEMHYARHRYFLEENQILDNLSCIPDVPVTIIHGRRDLTCLLESSWSVHQSLSHSKLVIVSDAGHLASEKTMVNALVDATDDMAARLR